MRSWQGYTAYVLALVCLLMKILHSLDEEGYTIEEACSDLTEALHLLGNASSQISRACRRKVLRTVNPDIQVLAGEEELFRAATPKLLGNGFERKVKDWAESMKLLAKAKALSPRSFLRAPLEEVAAK